MKKLFILLAICISFSTMSIAKESQDSTTTTTTTVVNSFSEVERLIDKYSSQVIDASKPSVTMLFKQAVKNQKVAGILFIVVPSSISLILFLIGFFLKSAQNANEEYYTIAFIAALLFLVIALLSSIAGIMLLATPEYYAAKEVLQILQNTL